VGALARIVGAKVGAAVGAAVASATYHGLTRAESTSAALTRTNHRGESVTLAQGPALVAGATIGAVATPGLDGSQRLAAALAIAGSGTLGAYDDLLGDSDTKGLRGHLTAAAEGNITSGFIKLVGIGAIGVAAGALARKGRGGVVDAALAGAVIAGSANVLNLLDLRPGRASKAFALLSTPYLVSPSGAMLAGPQGATASMLPHDLAERSMMGDAGANALGAAWGVCAVSRMNRGSLLVTAGAIAGLTLLSERVSFSDLIAQNPVTSWLDQLGRVAPPPSASWPPSD